MKHTKKLVMVPEDEYLALLSLVKKSDVLEYERAKIEHDMKKTLRNDSDSEEVKSIKYNWLDKQRRNISDKINNKPPQRVIVDNFPSNEAPSVPPYLGLTKPTQTPIAEMNESIVTPKSSKYITESFSSPVSLLDPSDAYITKEQYEDLQHYVDSNRQKFGIDENGKIKNQKNLFQKNTNFKKVLKFLADEKNVYKSKPPGYNQLYDRLKKDPFFQSLYSKATQSGSGKKRIIPIKTKGLVRLKPFRPQLWSRL